MNGTLNGLERRIDQLEADVYRLRAVDSAPDAPVGSFAGHQACSLCCAILPPSEAPWGGRPRCWEIDQLVTVNGTDVTLGARPGAIRCSLQLFELTDDAA